MSQLKSQLLDILPASERNLFQRNLTEAPTRAVSVERIDGVEALKKTLRDRTVHSFKYSKADDRLYVYYTNTSAMHKAMDFFAVEPAKIGHLEHQKSGPQSLRIDNASAFSAVVQTVNGKIETFDDYVRRSKALFADTHDAKDVSVIFRVDNIKKIIFATATSSRLRTADFEMSRRILATRSNSIRENKASGYQASAEFHYGDHVGTAKKTTQLADELIAYDETVACKDETQENTLLAGLRTTMAPTVPTVYFAGKFPQEVIDQFTRIVAGERLPAEPQMAIYDDVNAMSKTKGTAVALFYPNGKRVDIEAILASLRLDDKTAHVFPTGIAKAVLHDASVVDPAVIIMRDHSDSDTAYLVLSTTKGFHRHVVLKKRK